MSRESIVFMEIRYRVSRRLNSIQIGSFFVGRRSWEVLGGLGVRGLGVERIGGERIGVRGVRGVRRVVW